MTRTYPIKLLVALAAVAGGCKGETKQVDNPQTLDDLKKCEQAKKQKDELITSLTNEKPQWMRNQGQTGGEIVVTIEGNALTVKASPSGGTPPIHPRLARAASNEF